MRHYAIFGGILILLGLLGADTPPQPPAKAAAEKPAAATEQAGRRMKRRFGKSSSSSPRRTTPATPRPWRSSSPRMPKWWTTKAAARKAASRFRKFSPTSSRNIPKPTLRSTSSRSVSSARRWPIEDGMTTVVHCGRRICPAEPLRSRSRQAGRQVANGQRTRFPRRTAYRRGATQAVRMAGRRVGR